MEATHYHNTDRAFDLPLLSKNFNAMEMKRTRVVEFPPLTGRDLPRRLLSSKVFFWDVGIMTSVNRFRYIMKRFTKIRMDCVTDRSRRMVLLCTSNIIKGNNVNSFVTRYNGCHVYLWSYVYINEILIST